MRIALLGAGRIGHLHARLLMATPGVDALVVADADPARAVDAAGTVGATAAPSIEAALDDVDAVVIAAATTAHAEQLHRQMGGGDELFELSRELEALAATDRRPPVGPSLRERV